MAERENLMLTYDKLDNQGRSVKVMLIRDEQDSIDKIKRITTLESGEKYKELYRGGCQYFEQVLAEEINYLETKGYGNTLACIIMRIKLEKLTQ